MNRLRDIVIDEIRRNGPISVARYMSLALYHPEHGYYASGARRTGRAGHFLTSPELDPAFGALWAAAFERLWQRCGRPEPFTVIEVGPGEGGFAEGVLSTATGDFADVLAYRMVERAPALRERQEARLAPFPRLEWTDSPGSGVRAGVVFANEVLDNLPVHVVEGDREIVVAVDAYGALVEAQMPYSPEVAALLSRHGLKVPSGTRLEVPAAAGAFVRSCAAAIETGAVVFVDYGDVWARLLEREGGTILCYSETGADDDYLERPGNKDITAHANWSVVRIALEDAGLAVAGPAPQREVLEDLGIARLHDRLRDEIQAATAAGDGRLAVRAMSRRGALAALTNPSGLGRLGVLVGGTTDLLSDGAGPGGPAPDQGAGRIFS